MASNIKDIQGYESRYAVTTDGRIWSYPKSYGHYTSKGNFLKTKLVHGYEYVILTTYPRQQKTHKVHRLVAQAYISNPRGFKEVNHINGIKDDNRVKNLEWSTRQHNAKHAGILGLMRNGEEHHNAKLSKEQVLNIRELYQLHTQAQLAKMFGVSQTQISRVVNSNNWSKL